MNRCYLPNKNIHKTLFQKYTIDAVRPLQEWPRELTPQGVTETASGRGSGALTVVGETPGGGVVVL